MGSPNRGTVCFVDLWLQEMASPVLVWLNSLCFWLLFSKRAVSTKGLKTRSFVLRGTSSFCGYSLKDTATTASNSGSRRNHRCM